MVQGVLECCRYYFCSISCSYQFGNSKNSSVFYVKCLLISGLLVLAVQSDKRNACLANFGLDVKKFKISFKKVKPCNFVKCFSKIVSYFKNLM